MSGCTGFVESTTKQRGEGDQSFYSRIVKYFSPTVARPVILLSTLPRNLVKLDLGGCNLTDNDFPVDFYQLSSLRTLDLSRNLIHRLPGCVDTLDGIHSLSIDECPVLQSVDLCHRTTLQVLHLSNNRSLQILKLTPGNTQMKMFFYLNENLEEIEGYVKMASIGKVDKKVKISLCITTLMLSKNTTVMYEFGIYSTYFKGREVLNFFSFRENGSNISAILPPSLPDHLDSSIRGLNVSFVWRFHDYSYEGRVTLHNRTKDLRWIYVFGLPPGELGKDYTWVSFWKCRDLLEGGDEIHALIQLEGITEVMECGLKIFYDDATDNYEEFGTCPAHVFGDYGESEENANFDNDNDDDDDNNDYERKTLVRLSRANNDHEEEEDDKNENEEEEIHNNNNNNNVGVLRHRYYDHNAIEEDEDHSSHCRICWTDEILINFSDKRTPGITYCFNSISLDYIPVYEEDVQYFDWWGPVSTDNKCERDLWTTRSRLNIFRNSLH